MVISIHAPLAGSDFAASARSPRRRDFNPRSPCGERLKSCDREPGEWDFNPRSPCGERLITTRTVSIFTLFQSTLPLRGATTGYPEQSIEGCISIHAPLAGSDPCSRGPEKKDIDFNPRSPCGERPKSLPLVYNRELFQSTLPLRGATVRDEPLPFLFRHFNPRSPCGERPQSVDFYDLHLNFNPRSPCGERPVAVCLLCRSDFISIHAPLAGSDTVPLCLP
ncbi:hypothetical protein HMPREF0620_0513 [Parascardovia denticolens DSM 10105 = JCM 12538]|uniref:Uncharacterized protein n=1 Tax=Parascardovia denticolens DSM 10105 = JCM 12538 TaxID=864564 RepID=E6K127_PARDN|nr:hypothetical protein HMPREF0620_0513 [Parascardovia denticolens DSM 10105 = JCM 12538]